MKAPKEQPTPSPPSKTEAADAQGQRNRPSSTSPPQRRAQRRPTPSPNSQDPDAQIHETKRPIVPHRRRRRRPTGEEGTRTTLFRTPPSSPPRQQRLEHQTQKNWDYIHRPAQDPGSPIPPATKTATGDEEDHRPRRRKEEIAWESPSLYC